MATLGLLLEDGLGCRISGPSGFPVDLGRRETARLGIGARKNSRRVLTPVCKPPPPRIPTPKPALRASTPVAKRLPASDDVRWIRRIRKGDETAANELFLRLHPVVISIVRGHLPRRTQEEDLVQVVFTKVFAKLHQFSGLVPLEHWVSRIAVNTCLNQLKHEKIRPEWRMSDLGEEQEAVVQQMAAVPADPASESSRHAGEVVTDLLARLRPEEQLVLRLLHLEERSVEEIGRLTGWSISCVKVRAFRARARMRKLWDEVYGADVW